ncbi:MAG: hypothetical protein O8C61_00345 [Candidatus Methanoperedens sp.]|nr:hypothetical protein [Candidatus Methanoperedens sp.]
MGVRMSLEASKIKSEPLELSWEIGRGSVLYADDHFTVYISVKNVSDLPITIWDLGIMGCSDFYIQRYYAKTGSISGTPREGIGKILSKIICSIINYGPNVLEECEKGKTPDIENLSEEELRNKARKDILKEHYYNNLKKGTKYIPWQVSPDELLSVNFEVETKNFWLFRPDKYKLNLFADYSYRVNKFIFRWDEITEKHNEKLKEFLISDFGLDWIKDAEIKKEGTNTLKATHNNNLLYLKLIEEKHEAILTINCNEIEILVANKEDGKWNIYRNNEEFARVTKVEEIEILASMRSILSAGALGALFGTFARIIIKDPNTPFLSQPILGEFILAAILSIFAITALARRAGTQTIITIQDFWGGLFIGFMVGYAGHDYIDNLIGVKPGGILTNSANNSTNFSIP